MDLQTQHRIAGFGRLGQKHGRNDVAWSQVLMSQLKDDTKGWCGGIWCLFVFFFRFVKLALFDFNCTGSGWGSVLSLELHKHFVASKTSQNPLLSLWWVHNDWFSIFGWTIPFSVMRFVVNSCYRNKTDFALLHLRMYIHLSKIMHLFRLEYVPYVLA